MNEIEFDIYKAQVNQILNLAINSDDYDLFKSFSSDLQQRFPGGSWRTINGAKVFIDDGKVVAGLEGFNGKIDEFFTKKEAESKPKWQPKNVNELSNKVNDLIKQGGTVAAFEINRIIMTAPEQIRQGYYMENGVYDNKSFNKFFTDIAKKTGTYKPKAKSESGMPQIDKDALIKEAQSKFDMSHIPTDEPIWARMFQKGIKEEIEQMKKNAPTTPFPVKEKIGNKWIVGTIKTGTSSYIEESFDVKDDDLEEELALNLELRNRGVYDLKKQERYWNEDIVPKYGNKEYNKMYREAYEASQNKARNKKALIYNMMLINYIHHRLHE